jgi:hypothetical protein
MRFHPPVGDARLMTESPSEIKGASNMKRPLWVLVGGVLALLGLLFTLQGTDVIGGSAMSGTTFWAVAGPIIILVGLLVATVGVRGRVR